MRSNPARVGRPVALKKRTKLVATDSLGFFFVNKLSLQNSIAAFNVLKWRRGDLNPRSTVIEADSMTKTQRVPQRIKSFSRTGVRGVDLRKNYKWTEDSVRMPRSGPMDAESIHLTKELNFVKPGSCGGCQHYKRRITRVQRNPPIHRNFFRARSSGVGRSCQS
jgi:hypothetical protein